MANPYKKIKYREEKKNTPRTYACTNLRTKLRHNKIDGYYFIDNLEKILTDKGFGLPVKDGDHCVFSIGKYMRMYFVYADCLAVEILLLRELKMI